VTTSEWWLETRVGSQTGGITVSQAFPWFGARDLRGRVAVSEADAEFRLLAAEREVIARQHEALLAALRARDAEAAVRAVHEQTAYLRERFDAAQAMRRRKVASGAS